MPERGYRIITEGIDGTGKTTAADLIAYQLRRNGLEVIRVDEPDSAVDVDGNILVPAASELRKIIKNGSIDRSAEANVTLLTASRLANWVQASRPALERGAWVVQARSDKSSDVYQGYAEGVGIETVRAVTRASLGEEYMTPDFITILDFEETEASETERLKRIEGRGALENPDTFESRGDDFQLRVREGYRYIAALDGIDITYAHHDKYTVADQILNKMVGKLSLDLIRFDWPHQQQP